MNSSLGSEIVTGFIGEVEGYLPDMSRCLQTLQQDRAHRPSLAELHRITHTIKGAAAMVGLDDLSGVGDVLEKVMENVLGASLVLDDETINLLGDATQRINSYCMMQRAGKPDDGQLFQKTVATIEKKLAQCAVGRDEGEESTEESNPETILYDQAAEPEPTLEAAQDGLESKLGLFDDDDVGDFFAEEDVQASEEADSDSLLDEISSSSPPGVAAEDVEEEFLFQDVGNDDDELFESAVTEQAESSESEEFFSSGVMEHAVQDESEAEEMDPELLECFREETEEHLGNIDSCLNSLVVEITDSVELNPSTQETLHSLRRSVHTLKGAAAVIGIEQVAAWGHDFEDFLDWLHDEAQSLDPCTLIALREGADLLASLAEDPLCPVEKEAQRVTVKFADITEAFSSGTPVREHVEAESMTSSHIFDDEENALEQPEDSVADFFSDADSDASEEGDSFFDELTSSASPAEDVEDELLLQDVEEEENDLFASAVMDSPEVPEEVFTSGEPGYVAQESFQAEEIDPELLECFREETEEHLENIDSCLNSLSDQVTDSVELNPSTQETLHSLRRSVHTLKGAAAVIGIEPVAAWGHDFEDFLDWLHDEAQRLDPFTLAALREGADLLASLAEDPTCPAEKETQRIIARFADITESLSSGSTVTEHDNEAESAVDFLTEDDSGEAEEVDTRNLFEEISSPASSTEVAMEDEFLLQDDEQEDDFFGSVVAGLSGSPEDLFIPTGASGAEQGDVAAEAIDPELLECFREETNEHLENIDDCLNRLGAQVTAPIEPTATIRETLHSLRRSVHTLKGASAVIGIEQVAAWGHDFEDFLDWLHDEAQKLSPPIIALLRDGADLLAELAEDPTCPVEQRKKGLTEQFNGIIERGANEEKSSLLEKQDLFPDAADVTEEAQVSEEVAREGGEGTGNFFDELPVFTSEDADDDLENPSAHDIEKETLADSNFPAPSDQGVEVKRKPALGQRIQARKTATLRVDVNRIDQMVGLSGDMVINLSSFEDSTDAMSGTMKELDMILHRLKNINSSLEAGYELASIPHIGGQDDAQSSGVTEDFDPLEMDRYSELNILIRSLSEAVSDLDSIMAQNVLDHDTWQKTVEHQSMVLKELQNRMLGVRMTPLLTLSSRMHRTVREAERTTGHPARLTIEGESIMMDTRVWDVMADPLMHILRNAVAHGGRLPQKGGRYPLSITIQAIRKGGLCTLRVSDTGTGLDYEAIRIKGMKLYPNDRVNLMSDSELADLIFRHGFSSTGSVTNIAGRGVGMDVVRDAIDQLNGSIELISERGQGTEFIMRLPVAVAQLPAILARFGKQIYAIPMHDVASVARATPEEKKGREYTFDGENLPLLHPAKVPGFETGRGYVEENLTEDDQALLIVHAGRRRAAVLCEQLIGQRDVVFKDLGMHLHNVPCISGVTIMGNGTLIPILHVEEVLQKWTSEVKKRDEGLTVGPVKERGPLRILIVDDSISVRKVVSNFIAQQGWIPIAARNGIEAVEKIREEKPDFVLLDVEMPRMNGFEVLQALQAQPELRDIPVAMLTSRSAGKYQQKARDLGARGFMTKPFKADEVISFIRKETNDE